MFEGQRCGASASAIRTTDASTANIRPMKAAAIIRSRIHRGLRRDILQLTLVALKRSVSRNKARTLTARYA